MTETRNGTMDTARGLAVAGMIVAHFVPLEGIGPTADALFEGTPAALFFVLIGMAWAIQADRKPPTLGIVARRSLALLTLGLLLHILVWPTEVLIPYAVMMAPALLIRRGGRWAILASVIALNGLVVLGAGYFAQFSEGDWLESGSHVADHSFGWVTLRYLLFDGNYPLIPWLAFPLIGMLLVREGKVQSSRIGLAFGLSLIVAVAMAGLTYWTETHDLGDAATYLATTWVPTTVPFLLLHGALALAIIAGLSRWNLSSKWIAPVGRASLTHYLAHICLVFAPMRYFYGGEDWSVKVGLIASLGYWAAAVPLSVRWFRNHRRGPVEGLLARMSDL